MNIAQKAVDFVINTIKALDDRIIIDLSNRWLDMFIYLFHIELNDKKFDIEFGKARMDNFESAIENYSETSYYYELEKEIKFRIYETLGSNGLITDFEVSRELINEIEDRWKEGDSLYPVSLNQKMNESIFNGLNKLSDFLTYLITEHKIKRADIMAAKKGIDNLIAHYIKYNNLCDRASIDNLGLLKAAAVCEITHKEKERSQNSIPIVKSELTKGIFEIVSIIREEPFRRIKMPSFVADYSVAQKGENITNIKAKRTDDLDAMLDRLDLNLKNKRIGAWDTFGSNNPDRLSQAANSMVELLDKVIGILCGNMEFNEYLKKRYGVEEIKWIGVQRKSISETKAKLNRVKHHTNYTDEPIAEGLLVSAEAIMKALLATESSQIS
jgi:hypothetical protein